MEIEFDDRAGKQGKVTPKTRLYAPEKTAKDRAGRGKDARRGETVVDEDGYRIRIASDEIKPLSRFGLIACGFLFAGMLLFTLTGYERITRAYADINALNDQIEQTSLRITGLDVQIECAVTIQQAQEAAARFGMQYPQQDQYVNAGAYIPISGTYAATSDTADAGTGEDGDTGGSADTAAPVPDAPETLQIPDASGDLLG